MKVFLFFLLTLVELCWCQNDGMFWWSADKDEKEPRSERAIRSTTLSDPDPTSVKVLDIVCCECVPFFMCIDGKIVSDGVGLIDVRIGGEKPSTPPPVVNVDICPGDLDVCCQVPDADPICLTDSSPPPSSTTTEAPIEYITPHPESKCECIPYNTCHPDLVVSDGLGPTSLELSNGRKVNHSSCTHALDVCCYVPDLLGLFPEEVSSTPPPEATTGNEECECVPSYLCTPDGFIRTDGASILDVRVGPSKPLEICPYDPSMVCCIPPKSELNETGPIHKPEVRVPYKKACGHRNSQGIGVRILGFEEGQTQFGEFPWVASILRKDFLVEQEFLVFAGGASLIHPRVVLTAAHKIKDIPWESLLVRLGEWDTSAEKESLPHQDIGVEKVVFHPGYVSATLFHDVALVFLKEEAKEQFHIAPICPAKSLDDVIYDSCVVNGWGVDEFRSENYQRIMKSVNLPLVNKTRCQELLRKTRLSRHFVLHPSFICAGGEEGVDSCKGDGGGPLSCPSKEDPSNYLQVGITAWGIGCGGKDVPGVYADVAEHFTWIMDQINENYPQENAEILEEATEDPSSGGKNRKRNRNRNRKRNRENKRREREERRRNRQNKRRENRRGGDNNEEEGINNS